MEGEGGTTTKTPTTTSRVIPGTPNNGTPENGKRDPYYSHVRIPKDMGMVWEAYHKGGPIVGGP